MVTYHVEEVILEVDVVADMSISACGRHIAFETTVFGNTSWRGRAIDVTREGRNQVALMANREQTKVRIATSKLGKSITFISDAK